MGKHDALSQLGAFIYQIERGLFWLSGISEDGYVAIEHGDDVTVLNVNGERVISEQDKTSIGKNIPFNDLGKDLWNTLLIWLKSLEENQVKIDNCHFLLVTNKCIPKSRLIIKIESAFGKDNVELAKSLISELVDKGKSYSGIEKELYAGVLAYGEEKLFKLFSKIKVVDGNEITDRLALKDLIRNRLKISNNQPFNEIFEGLVGWLEDKVMENWESGVPVFIRGEELVVKAEALRMAYNLKPFREKAESALIIRSSHLKKGRDEVFVKQLKLINADEEDVVDAINDFFRAKWERTRFAKENTVSRQEFLLFDDNLIRRWKNIFKPLVKGIVDKLEKTGYDIYFKTTDHREDLIGYRTEQYYTTKGAYHMLANSLRLGWHPNWDKELKK